MSARPRSRTTFVRAPAVDAGGMTLRELADAVLAEHLTLEQAHVEAEARKALGLDIGTPRRGGPTTASEPVATATACSTCGRGTTDLDRDGEVQPCR